MQKVLLIGMSVFTLISVIACNSGGSTNSATPQYTYSSGKPYNFEYNLVNLQNVSISGDNTNPVLTCNLSVKSTSCSVTVKGNIGINGGGYIGFQDQYAAPVPPIYINNGLDPCIQDQNNPNNVNCTLTFTYYGGTESNSYLQGASFSLMSQNNIPQLFLLFNILPTY